MFIKNKNYFQNKEKEAQKVSGQQTSIFDFESERLND